MADNDQDLKLLLQIRQARLNRQSRVCKAAQQALQGKQSERESLHHKMEEEEHKYQDQHTKQINTFIGRNSDLRGLIELKEREQTFLMHRHKMTREGDVLFQQIQQSRTSYLQEKDKLNEMEKAKIKIEELIQMDWT